ncbi:MAG: RNA polymerase subunit sigma-70, partial [Chloroflexi bacterium]|nr:RNA polymerase subunit sigma-70 [Chloroflexota bacterium]
MSQSINFDPSSSSDEELLKYITRGNSFAFNCLYERYGQRLYAYALRLTENPAQAEDILQESMLIVWRKAATYRGEGSVQAWLLSIIRNKCMQ